VLNDFFLYDKIDQLRSLGLSDQRQQIGQRLDVFQAEGAELRLRNGA
jgi:hypothetical protein